MGKYKVVTYPMVGNEPYIKTDTNNFGEAKESFETAKAWNYTCVLYDASTDRLLGSFHSSLDSSTINLVVSGITGSGAAAALSVLSGKISLEVNACTCAAVYTAVSSKIGNGNALSKAIALAMTTKF